MTPDGGLLQILQDWGPAGAILLVLWGGARFVRQMQADHAAALESQAATFAATVKEMQVACGDTTKQASEALLKATAAMSAMSEHLRARPKE